MDADTEQPGLHIHEPEGDLESPLIPSTRVAVVEEAQEHSGPRNLVPSTVILSKTVIGAGIAALPLTDALLGWPLALVFLLSVASATYTSLLIVVRAITAEDSASYPEVVRRLLGQWAGLALEVSIVAFGIGLMLVYEVVIGDMLVGKEGYQGLVCGWLGGMDCNRRILVGLVTILVLIPAVSFRSMESSAFLSWVGMTALVVWAAGTLILLVSAAVQGKLAPVRLLPDKELLGGGGLRMLANVCAVIPVLTTAYSCQAAAPFVLEKLRPKSPSTMRAVTLAAVAITTALYALISLGSYLVFGDEVQADVLHNYTPERLEQLVAPTLARALYIIVRLSFLLGVMTLFPLMMFPARDGLVRIFSHRSGPLPTSAFYAVTYGITAAVFAISMVTPSIWGPLQIIGATAGAMIGFIIPGLLAFREPVIECRERLLDVEQAPQKHWRLANITGWLLIVIGVLQSIAGIASQALAT